MKNAIIATFVFLAMQAIVPTVGTYIIGVLDKTNGKTGNISSAVLNPTTLAVELICVYLLTVGALYAWRMLKPATGLHKTNKGIHLALVLMLLLIVIANIANEMLDLPDMIADKLPPLMQDPLSVACIVVFGPVVEEIVFRHVVIGSLIESGSKYETAIITSAILFAIVHLNPSQMPVAFVTGILLGWFYVRTGSIVTSVCCHIMNNSLGVILFLVSPEAKILSHIGDTTGALIIILACLAIGILLAKAYIRHTHADTSSPTSEEAMLPHN